MHRPARTSLLLLALAGCTSAASMLAEPRASSSDRWAQPPEGEATEQPSEATEQPPTPAIASAAGPASEATNRAPRARPADAKAARSELRSAPLPSGLFNPMPAGVMAGYRADTGLDLAGNRLPVFALAAGTLDYSEPGHTLWTGPGDTANTVRLALDEPIDLGDRQVTHVWYAHLSSLIYQQPEDASERIHVEGGEQLGVSGVANGSPHLHLGLLLDGDVSQRWGTFLLEDEVRQVLGSYQPGQRLPER